MLFDIGRFGEACFLADPVDIDITPATLPLNLLVDDPVLEQFILGILVKFHRPIEGRDKRRVDAEA